MNRGRQFVFLVALTLLVATGCAKRRPQLPSEAKAPAYPIATPLPGQIAEATELPPPSTSQPQSSGQKEEPAPKPAKRRKKKVTPPATQSAANSEAGINANNMALARPPEPVPDVAIAPDVNSTQLMHQKQTTAQLLDETERTLNGLKGNLSTGEQETLAQIRAYVSQSRKATTDGDFERAFNLATKAHLLSDALVKK